MKQLGYFVCLFFIHIFMGKSFLHLLLRNFSAVTQTSSFHIIFFPLSSQHEQHRYHVLLELIPVVWICVLKPLNRHQRTVIEHRLVNRPQATFSEHLRRCSEKFLQLELISPIEEHKPALVCAASPIAITLMKGLYILMCLKTGKRGDFAAWSVGTSRYSWTRKRLFKEIFVLWPP